LGGVHVLGIEDRDTSAIIIAMALDDLGMRYGLRPRPQLRPTEKGFGKGFRKRYLERDCRKWSGQRRWR